MNSKLNLLKKEIDTLKVTISRLESEIRLMSSLQSEVNTLRTHLIQTQNELNSIRAKNSKLNNDFILKKIKIGRKREKHKGD